MKASTMCRIALLGFIICVLTIPLFAADKYTFNPTQIEHGIVIADTTGKWAYMWPINQGLWSWGSEIVVHFTKNQWLGKNINNRRQYRTDQSNVE